MNKRWRLIPSIEASGFQQMAIDEWLLEQHRLGLGLPCLRFYSWQPVAISLGYHQHSYPHWWDSLQWNSQAIDIVKRPSGGRAVLHQGDLTYALVSSQLEGRRRDIYQYLCEFLIEGWRDLGINLSLGGENRRYHRAVSCFSASTTADLVMANGYKVVGSAQLYRDGCILQHGSMRLSPDPDLVKTIFGDSVQAPSALRQIQPADLAMVLAEAAKRVFKIELDLQPLSPQEISQACAWRLSRQAK